MSTIVVSEGQPTQPFKVGDLLKLKVFPTDPTIFLVTGIFPPNLRAVSFSKEGKKYEVNDEKPFPIQHFEPFQGTLTIKN